MAVRNKDIDGVARIKVIGVGGGGSNAVSRMYKDKIEGVDYFCVNTDAQALAKMEVPTRVRIGDQISKGMGVGGDPEIGRQAAEESREELEELVRDTDMVFVAAGMGGGTGTGAAPVIADIAKQSGALTVGIVTKPFSFEGMKRSRNAEEGIRKLREKVDTLIAIPNDRLFSVCSRDVTADSAFRVADEILKQGIQSIAELITNPGVINLDFADVKAIMTGAGPAWMAIGQGSGDNRAMEAAQQAIASPLLDASIDGAKGVLFNIVGGSDLKLSEIHEAAEVISRVVDPEANIIFGMVTDLKMEKELKITIIATGFPTSDAITSREEKEASRMLLEALGNESALDIPPFLRQHPGNRRRSVAAN